MKYRPVGFRVLIEMDVVDREIKEGALEGFQITSDSEHKREESGNCIGKVVAFGPTAFQGYAGCREDSAPSDFGVRIGDKVEFARYDGKIPLGDEEQRYRLINDVDVLMVIEDE